MKPTKTVILGRIITGLVIVFYTWNSMVKLFPEKLYPQIAEQMAAIGLQPSILPILAALELLCVLIYAIPATTVLGAVLFTGYMGGAILTHLRVGENVIMQVSFGIIIWLGVYLREPKLKQLFPFRKS